MLNPDFMGSFDRLMNTVSRLDGVLTQTNHKLKDSGLIPSPEFSGLVKALRQDLDTAQKGTQQALNNLQFLQKLVHTSALLTSSLELDEVLEEVIDVVVGLTGAERAYLVMHEADSDELSIRAARNWDGETIPNDEAAFSRGVIKAAIEQQEPMVTTNAIQDKRFQEMPSVFAYNVRSIVCIPLILRGQVIGVLYADNRVKPGVFSQEIIPLLTAFASQAAIAIENARLFTQVKADLDEAQRQVHHLRIQIDQSRADTQIDGIVETEFFQKLRDSARGIRPARKETHDPEEPTS